VARTTDFDHPSRAIRAKLSMIDGLDEHGVIVSEAPLTALDARGQE
jgi:hypothetical protein